MNLHRGQTLYHERDAAHCWYEVCAGLIRTCRYYPDGRRQVTGFYHSTDAFGVDRGYYHSSAEAVTEAIVRCHPHGDVDDHDGALPSEPFLIRALEQAEECIHLLGRRTATARLASFMIRLDERIADGAGLSLAMPREDIADHLGLTVETVSRTFSELAKRKVIAFRSAHLVTIIDMAALHRLAGEDGRPIMTVEQQVA